MSRILFVAKTDLDGITHEQIIICRQLFAGHVVGSQPMKMGEKIHRMINTFVFWKQVMYYFTSVTKYNLKYCYYYFKILLPVSYSAYNFGVTSARKASRYNSGMVRSGSVFCSWEGTRVLCFSSCLSINVCAFEATLKFMLTKVVFSGVHGGSLPGFTS